MGTTATVEVDLDPPRLQADQPQSGVEEYPDGACYLWVQSDGIAANLHFDSLEYLEEWARDIAETAKARRQQKQAS